MYLLYCMLHLLSIKLLLPSSTVSSEKYTYSIIHHLFQWEKILTSSIATPKKNTLSSAVSFSCRKYYYLLYNIFGKNLLNRLPSFSTGCTVLDPGTVQLQCCATRVLSFFFHLPMIIRWFSAHVLGPSFTFLQSIFQFFWQYLFYDYFSMLGNSSMVIFMVHDRSLLVVIQM
jgi:hypothetical protein